MQKGDQIRNPRDKKGYNKEGEIVTTYSANNMLLEGEKAAKDQQVM